MATRSSRPEHAHKAFENRKRKPELKREAVLLTAAHLFLKQGYRRTSMEDIADRLEITKPALYHYFMSKDDILVGCYSHGIANILGRLKHADEATGVWVGEDARVSACVDRSDYNARVWAVRGVAG